MTRQAARRDPVVPHLPQRVGEVRVPVAVAPVDRQVEAGGPEVLLDRGDERAVLVVDRAAATEEEVVLADLLETLPRDAASAGDVLQERDDVLGLLGPAERDEQQRVVRRGVGRSVMARRILGTSPGLDLRAHRPTAGCSASRRPGVLAQPAWSPGCRSRWSASASCCWCRRGPARTRSPAPCRPPTSSRRPSIAVLLARLVDRLGQSRVLPSAVAVFAAGWSLMMVAVETDWPAPWPHLFAAVAGPRCRRSARACGPGGRYLVTDKPELHTAFAFEAVVDETVFIVGPALVTAARHGGAPARRAWARGASPRWSAPVLVCAAADRAARLRRPTRQHRERPDAVADARPARSPARS